jgi:preprotein translocase subunit SecG
MNQTLLILQISIGLGLTITILMQARGVGLGRAWGGTNMAYHSKRGMEKLIFRLTIILATLFFINSILILVI